MSLIGKKVVEYTSSDDGTDPGINEGFMIDLDDSALSITPRANSAAVAIAFKSGIIYPIDIKAFVLTAATATKIWVVYGQKH